MAVGIVIELELTFLIWVALHERKLVVMKVGQAQAWLLSLQLPEPFL